MDFQLVERNLDLLRGLITIKGLLFVCIYTTIQAHIFAEKKLNVTVGLFVSHYTYIWTIHHKPMVPDVPEESVTMK